MFLWGYIHHFTSLTHEVEDELGDITSGDGDVLDGRANDIAFCDGDNVSDAITRVNDGASEGTIRYFGGP